MKVAVIVLSLIHVMSGCHVWGTANGAPLGANRTIVTHVGARLEIRISCPMDFDVAQIAGPKVAVGDPRWHTGTQHVLIFKKRGVYVFRATNVQTPEEVGLQTMGMPNTPKLTVKVR